MLGIGVAFKAGVDDLRESPALGVIERMLRKGARSSRYHDPFVPEVVIGGGPSPVRRRWTRPMVAEQDCVVDPDGPRGHRLAGR